MGKTARRLAAAVLSGAVCACAVASPPSPAAGLAAAAFVASPVAAWAAAGQAFFAQSSAAPALGSAAAQSPADTDPASGQDSASAAQSAAAESATQSADPSADQTGEQAATTAAPGAALTPLGNTSEPSALLAMPTDAIPAGMAAVTQRFYPDNSGGQTVSVGAGTLRNCTDLTNAQVAQMASGPLPFSVELNSAQPQVLIMHTHATECYMDSEQSWVDPSDGARTTDTDRNMVAVGAAMARILNTAGICTVQDTTLYDYPSYTGSYAASNAGVRAMLAQYPSIKVVLDVHRDAIGGADGSRTKPVFMWNGLKCAQVMIICGADNGGNLPNYQQNLRFAAAWQNAMATVVPGLARPCLFDYRYYNQDLTTGSLLIEIGAHGNTLDEAIRGGELAARALSALFQSGGA